QCAHHLPPGGDLGAGTQNAGAVAPVEPEDSSAVAGQQVGLPVAGEVTGAHDGGHGVPPGGAEHDSGPDDSISCDRVEPENAVLVAGEQVNAPVPIHVPGGGVLRDDSAQRNGQQPRDGETARAVARVEPHLVCTVHGQEVRVTVAGQVTGADDRLVDAPAGRYLRP